MPVKRMFDWLFVDQLFHKAERGETIFAPYGLAAGGYVVPPEREPSVRSGVRWLALVTLIGAMVLAVLVPRLVESRWGIALPLGWFIGYALLAFLVAFGTIIHALKRLTVGLEPAAARG
jgi:hypothetical protein